MIYPNLTFPNLPNRPYFYTNFVSTVDGKVQVINENKQKYWPIGSALDYKILIELRTYADVLIHGKNTAVGHKTVDSLGKKEFKTARKRLGKTKDLLYVVLSNHPTKQLHEQLKNDQGIPTRIMGLDIVSLASLLYKEGYKNVLVEGGPNIMGSFFKYDLIDELFLTIAPKIFGNEDHQTLTMVEGVLFPPNKIRNLKLLSVKKVKSELYLRYKILHY